MSARDAVLGLAVVLVVLSWVFAMIALLSPVSQAPGVYDPSRCEGYQFCVADYASAYYSELAGFLSSQAMHNTFSTLAEGLGVFAFATVVTFVSAQRLSGKGRILVATSSIRSVAIAVSAALSLSFAILAFYSPVRAVLDNYGISIFPRPILVFSPYWWYLTYCGLAEGFALAAVIFYAAPAVRSPMFLKTKLKVSHSVRVVLGLVATAGLGIFVYEEFFNILYANTGMPFAIVMFTALVDGPAEKAGLLAFESLAAACVALAVLRMRYGLSEGLRSGTLAFAGVAFVSQLALYLFDFKEMELNVAAFARKWMVGYFYLLNNWTVLIVSGCILAVLLTPSLRRIDGAPSRADLG